MKASQQQRLMIRLARKLVAIGKRLDPEDKELAEMAQTLDEVEDAFEEMQRFDPDEDED